jgi:hypothetical protein
VGNLDYVTAVANGVETIEPGVLAGRSTSIRAVLDGSRWAMFGGLVVLNIFDVITTAMVLDRGGEERNPFVQPFVDGIWQVAGLKALILVLVATLLARCQGSRIAEFSLAAATGWYLAVVCWNIAVLTIL